MAWSSFLQLYFHPIFLPSPKSFGLIFSSLTTQMLRSVNKLEMLQAHLGYILESTLLEEMAQVAKIRETAADEIVVNVGDHLQMIPIVIDGSIKISRENESGDELLLYYMEGGDTCAMSLQCCTRKIDSQIKATSMEPSLLLMFPTEYMERWLDQYKTWRQFILDSYQRLLKQLETRGEIKLSRNKIILLKF